MSLSLPEQIIQRNAEVHLLRDILPHFDPDHFDKAKTKYRKPSYQRDLTKSNSWNKALINSILQGKAIGGIVMSKWSKSVDGEVDTYYNIEDGGTRLGACKKFFLGEFESDYGGIDQTEIKDRFLNYKVAVEILDKAHTRKKIVLILKNYATILVYYKRVLLYQPATDMLPMLVIMNLVLEDLLLLILLLKKFQKTKIIKHILDYMMSHPEGQMKKLASGVALISGMVLGPKFANTQYFLHVPILYKLISKAAKAKFKIVKIYI